LDGPERHEGHGRRLIQRIRKNELRLLLTISRPSGRTKNYSTALSPGRAGRRSVGPPVRRTAFSMTMSSAGRCLDRRWPSSWKWAGVCAEGRAGHQCALPGPVLGAPQAGRHAAPCKNRAYSALDRALICCSYSRARRSTGRPSAGRKRINAATGDADCDAGIMPVNHWWGGKAEGPLAHEIVSP